MSAEPKRGCRCSTQSSGVIEHIKLKTLGHDDAAAFTKALIESLSVLMGRGKTRDMKIQNVGVGCAGTFNPDGSVKISPNIPFLKDYSFRPIIAQQTGANVMVMNDAAAGL